MKLSQYKEYNKSRRKRVDDETELGDDSEGTLGYFVSSHQIQHFTVPIDGSFREPAYYRGVIQMLMQASEQDTVAFLINSPGGALSGLLSLLEAINMTEAKTVALIVGNASSAASMFALHCNEVYVGDNATFLCHNITYGTAGKGADVLAHVQHTSSSANKLLRKTYKYFLTEQEINAMIDGKEIYLESDEIVQRLEQRQLHWEADELEQNKAILAAEAELAESSKFPTKKPANKPARKTPAKKAPKKE